MFRKMLFAVLTIIPGLLLPAQGAEPKLRPEMLVTTGWLAENLSEPDVIVLCINSTPEFYTKGHFPGPGRSSWRTSRLPATAFPTSCRR